MRTDIVRTYKDIHSWVGIISGLALFIAFYAGAITMFEGPLQRWASPPPSLAAPPSLTDTPSLIAKVLAAHPEAAKGYRVHMRTGPENPARISWTTGNRREPGATYYAALDADGGLQVSMQGPSPVARFIDVLHQQVGLPFSHGVAMSIMGAIALLYAVALVSGVICLLPSLIKDLFALRLGKNLKRMWLDVHNVLGLFSLPFHIVMALTSVVFAFHDQFYDAQDAVAAIGRPAAAHPREAHVAPTSGRILAPAEIARRFEAQMPDFRIQTIEYRTSGPAGTSVRVTGDDPRYGMRGPGFTFAGVDPHSGAIIEDDYLPGRQNGWFATVSSFFALHFGSFGGTPVRWAYFFLGLAGAFLFYSGNLLWIESRRRKERKAGAVEQTRATRVLASLTLGVSLGCVIGISLTIAAAKWLPEAWSDKAAWHGRIYYASFLIAVGWAMLRGAPRASAELLWGAAIATAIIPLTSLAGAMGAPAVWNHADASMLLDLVAMFGAAGMGAMAIAARRRSMSVPRDSAWARAGAVRKNGKGAVARSSAS